MSHTNQQGHMKDDRVLMGIVIDRGADCLCHRDVIAKQQQQDTNDVCITHY